MDRLLILDPQDVTVRVEIGKRSVGVLQLRNVMHTMPVAFEILTSAPKKYVVKPSHAVIAPLGVVSVDIIINPQNDLPDSFPRCSDMFTVKSVLLPGSFHGQAAVSLDWFTSKKKAVFSDTGLRVMLVGGGIIRNLISRGCMDEMRQVLERDPAVADSADELGQRSMHVAISMKRPELVQLLLEFEVNLELRNNAGQTPLQQAAQAGEALITELLLAHGANTEARNSLGWTSLHYASVKGHYNVMKLLLDHGANIDAAIHDGRAAIHIVVAEGHKHCLKLLLDKGCNVDAKSSDGGTPLHTASSRGHVAFVRLLLHSGANKDVRNCEGRTPYDDAKQSGQEVLFDVLYLGDCLRQSATKGDLKSVKRLVGKGAIISGKDQHGWTALHRAAFKGRTDVVSFLIENGASLDQKDKEGYTALHAAVESGQKDVVQVLVEKGSNVNEKTKRGLTPLQVAAGHKYTGIVRILVEVGSLGDALGSIDQLSWESFDASLDSDRHSTKMEAISKQRKAYKSKEQFRIPSIDSRVSCTAL